MRCQNPVKRWKTSKAIPLFSMCFSILVVDKKAKNSRQRIPERYPMIPKTPKVEKAKGSLKCGWSQELKEVLTATHIYIYITSGFLRDKPYDESKCHLASSKFDQMLFNAHGKVSKSSWKTLTVSISHLFRTRFVLSPFPSQKSVGKSH